MADLIVKDGQLYRYPATINTLNSILRQEGVNGRVPGGRELPVTVSGYTLLKPAPSTKPTGYRVTEITPIVIDSVWTTQYSSRDATQDELDNDAAIERAALKMSGIAFTDVTGANTGTLMLSAMADDQFGLESVRRNVMAGLEFNYKFDNGTVVVLNSANFDNLEAVWLPFRASFF